MKFFYWIMNRLGYSYIYCFMHIDHSGPIPLHGGAIVVVDAPLKSYRMPSILDDYRDKNGDVSITAIFKLGWEKQRKPRTAGAKK